MIDAKVLDQSFCIMASANHHESHFEGLPKPRFLKAEIVSVYTDSVKISWILRCYSAGIEDTHLSIPDDEESIPPNNLYNPQLKKLKVLLDFVSLGYSLGDNALLKLTESDLRNMKNVFKKFHCGGDVKDHIADIEMKQLCRNKYGSRFGKKNVTSKKLYHTAYILPDCHQNVHIAIPLIQVEAISENVLQERLNRLLELYDISQSEDIILNALTSKFLFYISKFFIREDFSSVFVEILNTLRVHGLGREHDLLRYFLNRRTKVDNEELENVKLKTTQDLSSLFFLESEVQPFESNPQNYLMVDDPSNFKDLTKSPTEGI